LFLSIQLWTIVVLALYALSYADEALLGRLESKSNYWEAPRN